MTVKIRQNDNNHNKILNLSIKEIPIKLCTTSASMLLYKHVYNM